MNNLSKLFNQRVIISALYGAFIFESIIKLIDSFYDNSLGYVAETLATVLILIALSLMCLNFFRKILRYFKDDDREKFLNIALTGVFGILLYLSANKSFYSLITFAFIVLYIRMELLIRTSKKEKCSDKIISFFRKYRNIYVGLIFISLIITVPLDFGIIDYFDLKSNENNEIKILDREVFSLEQKGILSSEFSENYKNLKANYYQSNLGFMVSVSLIAFSLFIYAVYIIRNIIGRDNKFESDFTEIREELIEKFGNKKQEESTNEFSIKTKEKKNAILVLINLIRPTSIYAGVISFLISLILGNILLNSLVLGLVVFSTSSYGFSLNDYFDKEKDKINHKNRVLPSGLLTDISVFKISVAFFLFTLLLIPILSEFQQTISIITLILLSVYSYINNKFGFLSNIITSLCSSLAIIITLEYFQMSLVFAISIITFFYILSREIILDIYDIEADRTQGKTSVPLYFGKKKANIIASLFFVLSFILTICISLYYNNIAFLIFTGIIGTFLNVYSYINYLNKQTDSSFEKFDLISRASFILVLIAFI